MKISLNRIFFCFLSLFSAAVAVSQVLPDTGAKLNYTQIMFQHRATPGAEAYVLQVTPAWDSTFGHPVAVERYEATAIMLSDFAFGEKYIWRYAALVHNNNTGWQGPYNFEIVTAPPVDRNLVRAVVSANSPASGLLLLDFARVIINRNGKPVWYLPADTNTAFIKNPRLLTKFPNLINDTNFLKVQHSANSLMQVSDLRLTPAGTITLINDVKAEERDLKGGVLWSAPKKELPPDSNFVRNPYAYNHCFKRLASGNYMVIDLDAPLLDHLLNDPAHFAGTKDSSNRLVSEIIKEFDRKGKLVWSWSSVNYFDSAERRAMLNAKPDSFLLNAMPGGHMNAFDVDEKNGFVYAGFRNVSRVIKIDKSTGKVVCAWGLGMTCNGMPNAAGFFLKQHETTLLRNGDIAVFNNNDPVKVGLSEGKGLSSVVIFTQPTGKRNSRISWKFDCNLDSVNNGSLRGGSVDELKNGNLLVCTGISGRVFEITRAKKIVWSMLMQHRTKADSGWTRTNLYQAHYTSSLYPCYFTIRAPASIPANAKLLKIKIFNVGTENDTYLISTAGQPTTSCFIPAGKSVEVKIRIGKASTESGPDITVQSQTNPDFKRNASVHFIN